MRLLLALLLAAPSLAVPVEDDEDVLDFGSQASAERFLDEYNEASLALTNAAVVASWNHATNLTDHNAKLEREANERSSKFEAEAAANASRFDTSRFSADVAARMALVGHHPLPADQMRELSEIQSQLSTIYASTKVCLGKEGDECQGISDLGGIMGSSTDYYERMKVWEEWRKAVGRKMKPLYERYVELKNAAARAGGHSDQGAAWRAGYASDTFEQEVMDMYTEMEPMYRELHAYVRAKLRETYGEDHIDPNGKLPAHLLGDMWGRFWASLYDHMVPYPDKPSIDPSEEMKRQNYTVEKIFRTADNFYANLGMLRAPDSFWTLSMLRKPEDGREVQCHPTAWDFYDGKDFRIKMCARDFSYGVMSTAYHELGHTQYQMQYAHLPGVYRDGANSGFHEAIGELMAMAAATPSHLHKIGLLKELVEDDEQDINFLMSQSLITISTLPFHLVNDLWRWKVFRGEIPKEKWNAEYWRLKGEFLGVGVPVMRSGDDLDPPTIFHISNDYDMIRYFTRTILQFQFFESLCSISGHQGPLHRCDFSGSKEAGTALAKMLRLGSSVPWQDALETLTGERKMSARPILQFFAPLYEWLKKTNRENGNEPGWSRSLV